MLLTVLCVYFNSSDSTIEEVDSPQKVAQGTQDKHL